MQTYVGDVGQPPASPLVTVRLTSAATLSKVVFFLALVPRVGLCWYAYAANGTTWFGERRIRATDCWRGTGLCARFAPGFTRGRLYCVLVPICLLCVTGWTYALIRSRWILVLIVCAGWRFRGGRDVFPIGQW